MPNFYAKTVGLRISYKLYAKLLYANTVGVGNSCEMYAVFFVILLEFYDFLTFIFSGSFCDVKFGYFRPQKLKDSSHFTKHLLQMF